MIVVGFEDRDGGQRRVVVRDLVGGTTLKEEDLGTRDGAQVANWSWQDGPGGARGSRVVTKGLGVGAATRGDNSERTPMRFPPDGGVGMRVHALWSYYPAEDVGDELMFPKGAEIREVEDINGDWFWGAYAGAKGLFPGGYVKVLDVVTM